MTEKKNIQNTDTEEIFSSVLGGVELDRKKQKKYLQQVKECWEEKNGMAWRFIKFLKKIKKKKKK